MPSPKTISDDYQLASFLQTTLLLVVDAYGLDTIPLDSWDNLDENERNCWLAVAQAARRELTKAI